MLRPRRPHLFPSPLCVPLYSLHIFGIYSTAYVAIPVVARSCFAAILPLTPGLRSLLFRSAETYNSGRMTVSLLHLEQANAHVYFAWSRSRCFSSVKLRIACFWLVNCVGAYSVDDQPICRCHRSSFVTSSRDVLSPLMPWPRLYWPYGRHPLFRCLADMACELSPWLVRSPHPSIALITTLSEFLRRCSSKREAEMGSCSLAVTSRCSPAVSGRRSRDEYGGGALSIRA